MSKQIIKLKLLQCFNSDINQPVSLSLDMQNLMSCKSSTLSTISTQYGTQHAMCLLLLLEQGERILEDLLLTLVLGTKSEKHDKYYNIEWKKYNKVKRKMRGKKIV